MSFIIQVKEGHYEKELCNSIYTCMIILYEHACCQ